MFFNGLDGSLIRRVVMSQFQNVKVATLGLFFVLSIGPVVIGQSR
jgi:hypothetical protein